ncbi:MAG: hypothetical protein HC804_05785 [Anaerolineae bacterium]|nr:hypothetical protein [Anaerolineae bacterium]
MGDHVLVVGATLLDTKGKPEAGLEPNTSNPAMVRVTRGGTARNVAENLALLGAEVVLLSAIGDDLIGHSLVEQTAVSGVDVTNVQVIEGERTGTYMALLEEDGSLAVALDDVRVMQHITAAYLQQHGRHFAEAVLVMVDGSLTTDALETAVTLCRAYNVPLCADPSSARLAFKLRPYLPYLHLVVPNEVEAAELCQCEYEGFDPEASLDLARRLVRQGVKTSIVTLSDFGLVYATTDETGYLPPSYSEW